MSTDRKCCICSALLQSGTTVVIGKHDFCREHGTEALKQLDDWLDKWLIPGMRQEIDNDQG